MNRALGLICLMTLSLAGYSAFGQGYRDGKLWLNNDGSHYFKFTFASQIWLRNTSMNPGTTINDHAKSNYTDIGIRRVRVQAYGQIADRVFIYTQIGENNFNFLSDRKFGLFVHDALGEYEVLDKHLSLGGGLTAWNGLSRFSAPSIGNIMGIDAPLFEQNTNDVTDQFLRKLSVYAKGKLGKLDYRLVMSNPMSITKSAFYDPNVTVNANFSDKPANMQWHGYFKYEFLEQEANTTAYHTGTYLGKKRVFNIGAGFQYQPDAMRYLGNVGDTVHTAMRNFAIDAYYDAPLSADGRAISAYAVYMNTYYGPGYLRNQGVMNPANGTNDATIINGFGNGYPSFGTGNLYYAQVGYKFKDDLIGKTSIMPYLNAQYAHYERLNDPMLFWDVGVNWLLNGHTSKLTLAYQNRPIYQRVAGNDTADKIGTKGAFLLQYQVFLN